MPDVTKLTFQGVDPQDGGVNLIDYQEAPAQIPGNGRSFTKVVPEPDSRDNLNP